MSPPPLHSAPDPPTEELPPVKANKLDAVLDHDQPEVQTYLAIRRRNRRLFIIVGVILVAFIVGWVLWRLAARSGENSDQLGHQQELIDKLAVQVDSAIQQGADVSTPEQVADQVTGAQPTPAGPQGERGEAGPVGPAGPPGVVLQTDVENAVASYCASGICRGPTGATGEAGAAGASAPPPTDAQVAQAVAAYCSTGACTGPPGPAGSTGSTGNTGAEGPAGNNGSNGDTGATGAQGDPGPPGVQGEPGPPGATGPGPTPEQISAAVAEFCANNACSTGPAGPPGPAGGAGPSGPAGPAGPPGPTGSTPTNLSCTPSDPANLGAPWTCVAA